MKILELELARVAVAKMTPRRLGLDHERTMRSAVDAHRLIRQAEENLQHAEQAGLIALQWGPEQMLVNLYDQWLDAAEALRPKVAHACSANLLARFDHCLAHAYDWLEVHHSFSNRASDRREADALALL